jgi:hypothetical protein
LRYVVARQVTVVVRGERECSKMELLGRAGEAVAKIMWLNAGGIFLALVASLMVLAGAADSSSKWSAMEASGTKAPWLVAVAFMAELPQRVCAAVEELALAGGAEFFGDLLQAGARSVVLGRGARDGGGSVGGLVGGAHGKLFREG